MKLKAVLLAIAAILLMVAVANAAAPRAVDARDFDIAGVKLGMSWDEAVAAAAKHFKVSPDSRIKIPGKPNFLRFDSDGATLVAHFVMRVPVDASRPLVAFDIGYFLPQTATNEACAFRPYLGTSAERVRRAAKESKA